MQHWAYTVQTRKSTSDYDYPIKGMAFNPTYDTVFTGLNFIPSFSSLGNF